jgi:hypothetical protein
LCQAEANVELKSAPLWYRDQSRTPHQPARKALFGAIHAVLELQKIYRYAGWFRIEDYLGQGYGAYLSPALDAHIVTLYDGFAGSPAISMILKWDDVG